MGTLKDCLYEFKKLESPSEEHSDWKAYISQEMLDRSKEINADGYTKREADKAAYDRVMAELDTEYDDVMSQVGDVEEYQVTAYQGGPTAHTGYKSEYLLTGEGHHAFGWGHYFSDLEDIGRGYAEMGGSQRQYKGVMSLVKSLNDKDFKDFVSAVIDDYALDITDSKEQILHDIEESMGSGGSSSVADFTEALEEIGKQVSTYTRNLYKVTLHKGKEVGEYEWLGWGKKNTEAQLRKIQARAKKEGLSLKPITEIKDGMKVQGEGTIGVKESEFGEKYTLEMDSGAIFSLSKEDAWRLIGEVKTGGNLYQSITQELGSDKEASLFLLRAGIDGIKYPTGTLSGIKNSKDFNYVVFDENAITIEEHEQYQQALEITPHKYATDEQIKDFFKGQEVAIDGDNITVTTTKGDELNIKRVEFIHPNSVKFAMSLKGKGIAGSVKGNDIKLSLLANKTTLGHEVEHWLENSGLISETDIDALKGEIERQVKSGKWKANKEIGGKEDRAEWVADNLARRSEYKGVIRQILDKIADLYDGMVNYFHRTAKGVLRDIESGVIYGKDALADSKGVNQFAQSTDFSLTKAVKNILDNPNFRKWFGKSEVVDDDGNPLTVYHGRGAVGDSFTGEKGLASSRTTTNDLGDWFTDDAETASHFAWPNVIPKKGSAPRVYPVHLSIKNPARYDTFDALADELSMYDTSQEFVEDLKGQGFDGIIVESSTTDTGIERSDFVAFESTQIKSIYNRGSFSETDPRIDYQTVDTDLLEGVSDDTKKSLGGSKGIVKPKIKDRIKDSVDRIWRMFTRAHEDLDPKKYGHIADILRLYSVIPKNMRRKAGEQIETILEPLGKDPKKYDVFRYKLIFDDMLRDIEDGTLDPDNVDDPDQFLPFHLENQDQVQMLADRMTNIAENDTDITNALEKRKEIMDDMRQQLVDNKLIDASVLEDDRYFHHQVLEYYNAKLLGEDYELKTGTSSGDVRTHRKGWQIARKGSVKEYNTQYVEAEYEVLSQALAQIETKKTLDKLEEHLNIRTSLEEAAKAKNLQMIHEMYPDEDPLDEKKKFIKDTLGKRFRTWGSSDILPSDYTAWKPSPNSVWYKVHSITDRMLEQLREGSSDIDPAKVKDVLAKGADEQWVIPRDIGKTLDNFRQFPDDNPLSQASAAMINKWKSWTLINTFRFVKYNINNTSGDTDITFAYDPIILKDYTAKSLKDLYPEYRGKKLSPAMKKEIDIAYEHDILGSGWSVQEVSDVASQLGYKEHMAALLDAKPNLIQKYWRGSVNFTTYRENILRLAAFRYFQDKIKEGRKPGVNLNGVSDKEEIKRMVENGLPDVQIAAKLARELIGDYGNISQAGMWIRSHMIPFYSWMEINAPRYIRLVQNLPHEGKSTKALSGAMAWKATKLGIKASGLYGAVTLWNMTFFPDEEDELGEAGRRQLHLILGRQSDGKITSLRFQGAFSDFLSYGGLEDLLHDIEDVATGKQTIGDKVGEAGEAIVNKFWHGSRPMIKSLGETVMGRATYPDVFFPRPIRDKWEHIARTFSLNIPYKWVAGKPKKGADVTEKLFTDIMSLGFYSSDPGESAYYDVKKYAFDFLDKEGIEKPSIIPSSKSKALYYYKQALKYGDLKAAEKYLGKYKELGGNMRSLKISVAASHPVWTIPKNLRFKFKRSLTGKQKETYDMAVEWYNNTYRKRR